MRDEPFFQVGGTLSGDAASYIERRADRALLEVLERGDFGLVLAPRQSGKSSLMAHALPRLRSRGWAAGFIDLQSLGGEVDPDVWFRDVVYRIVRSLKLGIDHVAWWSSRAGLGATTRFAAFLEEEVLRKHQGRVVLFIDEIDAALATPFSDDFFTTVRSLYNDRATNPELRRLSLVLLGVAHPTDFVRGRRRTPFNIGTAIELADFDRGALGPFEAVFGAGSAPLLDRILHWTGGQPFLFQEVAASVHENASLRVPAGIDRHIEATYTARDIERNTHFRFINDFLLDGAVHREDMLARVREVANGNPKRFDDNSPVDQRLKLSGLIRVANGLPSIRNRIYGKVFDEAWIARNQSEAARGHALAPGTVVGGVTIESVLGIGGFGITYAGADIQDGRKVALKEFIPSSIASRLSDGSVVPLSREDGDVFEWGLERFRQESRMLARLDHPNMMRLRRTVSANGTEYMVMDYVEGVNLDAILRRDGTLSEGELMHIVAPLLDALDHLHKQGILHRDIKPSNVIITPEGAPILLDFGAARHALGSQAREITAIVTPGYAPFEQYSDTGVQGPWTDLYGLGGLMYRAATGERPPDAPARIISDDYVRAAERLRGKFSTAFLAAIDAALEIDERRRPQSVQEFREILGGTAPPPASAPVAIPEPFTGMPALEQRARARASEWAAGKHRNTRRTYVLVGGAILAGIVLFILGTVVGSGW